MKKFKCSVFSCFCLFSDSSAEKIDKNDITPKPIVNTDKLRYRLANEITEISNPIQEQANNQSLQVNK